MVRAFHVHPVIVTMSWAAHPPLALRCGARRRDVHPWQPAAVRVPVMFQVEEPLLMIFACTFQQVLKGRRLLLHVDLGARGAVTAFDLGLKPRQRFRSPLPSSWLGYQGLKVCVDRVADQRPSL
eukprot:2791579-Rhodomonas_salina.1